MHIMTCNFIIKHLGIYLYQIVRTRLKMTRRPIPSSDSVHSRTVHLDLKNLAR